jgi:hypothetical protein
MRRLFIDLDGVLADFDRHFETVIGPRTDYDRGDSKQQGPFWRAVTAQRTFFADLPLMPDALQLWTGANQYADPTILTGVPYSMPWVPDQKRAWVAKHFGSAVPVITCRSVDKCLHGSPGDVLIDDWPKYIGKWEQMGGIFVLHTSAVASLAELHQLFTPR